MNPYVQYVLALLLGYAIGSIMRFLRPGRFKYNFRRYCGWFPYQPCVACNKWYWGGLPFRGWQAVYQECCSKKCHDALGGF